MRVFLWVVMLVVTMVVAPVAIAADGPYVSGSVGATWIDDIEDDGVEVEFDTGYNLGIALGYTMSQFRLEGELGYAQADADELSVDGVGSVSADGDVSATRFMANGYWDIGTETAFTPYLGLGIGAAIVSVNDLEVMNIKVLDDDDTVFAYQFMAGIGYSVSKAVVLDLSYRYFATDDPELEDEAGAKGEVDVETHNVLFGLRYSF